MLLLQWPLRRFMRWLLGPLFPVEVSRLSRRGSTFWLRGGYALALLAALYSKFPYQVLLSVNETANFAQEFAELFLLVQAIAVLVLTPIWFGGAISDEKERHSLDFLLTSQLTSREIVVGKYSARLLALMSVLLSGLPVLVLTLFWGGVDLPRVLALFVVALLSLFSQGAICTFCSVLAQTTTGAIARACIATIAMSCCCVGVSLGSVATPIHYQLLHHADPNADLSSWADQFEGLGRYALVHGLLALTMLGLAVWQLRLRAGPPSSIAVGPPPPKPDDEHEPSADPLTPLQALMALQSETAIQIGGAPIVRVPPATLTFWHPIGRHAILWKERYRPGVADLVSDSLWLYFGVLVAALTIPAILLPREITTAFDLRQIFMAVFPALTIGLSLGLILQLAGTITRERELRTLESLLVLPESRGRILLEKWLGAVLRRLRWFIAIGALAALGVISGIMSPWAGLLTALLAPAQALLVSVISLLASLLSQSTVRAHIAALVAVLAILIVSLFANQYQGIASSENYPSHFQLRAALNPVSAWVLARDINRSGDESNGSLVSSLALGIAGYVGATGALGALAFWRFRRMSRFE